MGVLWMLLCLQRGAFQGLRTYRPVAISIVGEAAGRLVCSLVLVAAGLGVAGALSAHRSRSCSSRCGSNASCIGESGR
jgi:O-antigen/teichoic acid export membrane protein